MKSETPKHHTVSHWYIEEFDPCNPEEGWGSIYYGYKYTYEEAIAKIKEHRKQEQRTSGARRRKYRLVCETRQYYYY